MSLDHVDPDLLLDFITESTELVETLDQDLVRLESASTRPEIRYHIGTALARLGRRDEALEQFRRALALDPRFEHAKEMLRRTQQPADSHRNRTP